MRHAYTALVRGRVQGVNFREFARRKAVAGGLVGYTHNLRDGSTVEVYAEGDEAALQCLLDELRSGPALARVDQVEVTWSEARGGLEGFHIFW